LYLNHPFQNFVIIIFLPFNSMELVKLSGFAKVPPPEWHNDKPIAMVNHPDKDLGSGIILREKSPS
jgi:hypothetical protein